MQVLLAEGAIATLGIWAWHMFEGTDHDLDGLFQLCLHFADAASHYDVPAMLAVALSAVGA